MKTHTLIVVAILEPKIIGVEADKAIRKMGYDGLIEWSLSVLAEGFRFCGKIR